MIVYAEDNLWPTVVGNTSDIDETGEDGSTQYRYVWRRPEESPSTGVKMLGDADEGTVNSKSCSFDNNTDKCEILFGSEDFSGVTGTVNIDVRPSFKPGARMCKTVDKPFYTLMIAVPPPTRLASNQIAIIAVACVAVVVIGCVVPPLVKKYIKSSSQCISLKDGLEFLNYCTSHIQGCTSDLKNHDVDRPVDLSGVYRKSTTKSVIVSFVEDYNKKKGDPELLYSMSSVQLGSAVKYFLNNEKSPWLPPTMQTQITMGEKKFELKNGEFDSETVRRLIFGQRKPHDLTKFDILRHVFKHLFWFVEKRESMNEDQRSSVVQIGGLATCISPNLFKEMSVTGLTPEEGDVRNQRQLEFVKKLITSHSEVFAAEQEDHDVTAIGNTTGVPLMSV